MQQTATTAIWCWKVHIQNSHLVWCMKCTYVPNGHLFIFSVDKYYAEYQTAKNGQLFIFSVGRYYAEVPNSYLLIHFLVSTVCLLKYCNCLPKCWTATVDILSWQMHVLRSIQQPCADIFHWPTASAEVVNSHLLIFSDGKYMCRDTTQPSLYIHFWLKYIIWNTKQPSVDILSRTVHTEVPNSHLFILCQNMYWSTEQPSVDILSWTVHTEVPNIHLFILFASMCTYWSTE